MLKAKLLAAAAQQNGTPPPPVFTDTYQMEVPTGFVNTGTIFGSNSLIASATGTSFFAVGGVAGGTNYAALMSKSTSGLSTGTWLSLTGTSAWGSNCNGGLDKVDSTHCIYVYPSNTTIYQVHAQYIANAAGTLSAAVADTLVATSPDTTSNCNGIVTVLDTSNALVLLVSASHANNVMSLINPTTLAGIQSNTNASAITTTSYNSSYDMVKLSATRALISWRDGTSDLQVATVDVVSGTSFTINAAVALGPTGSNAAAIYGISATSAVAVYQKSSSIVAARVLTIAGGGSITVGTEYAIATTSTMSTQMLAKIAAYGTGDYITGYVSNADNRFYSLSFNVSGTVVEWDTSANSVLVTQSNANNMSGNLNGGAFINLSTSLLALVYASRNADGAGGSFAGLVDVGPSITSWSTFSGSGGGLISNSSANTVYQNPSIIYTGTNTCIGSGHSAGGSLQFYLFNSMSASSTASAFSSLVNTSGSANVTAAMCNLGIGTSAGNRVLVAYATSSTAVGVRVASALTNTLTLGTASSFAVSGLSAGGTGQLNLIPLTADTAMYIGFDNSTSPTNLSATIITVTAGATTIASTGSYGALINPAGENMVTGNAFLQWASIDSSHVAILFLTQNTVTTNYSLKMCIANVSGGVISIGSIVNVYTGYANAPSHIGIEVFGNGTGIVTYANDASPSTILYANGFTYSGTTITLGTQNSIATGLSLGAAVNGNGNKTLTKVSSTEAMSYTVEGGSAKFRKLTYVNVNSVTGVSPITFGTQSGASGGLIPTDNYNNSFMAFYVDSGPGINFEQFFRG